MLSRLIDVRSLGEGRFRADRSPDKGHRIYGGQYLAQCLSAAGATVAAERAVSSLHAVFLREGDVDLDLELQVEMLRDGRTFSSREVIAGQQGRVLFRMLVSYQAPESSPEYLCAAMPSVPSPEETPFTYDDFTLAQTGEDAWHGTDRPMDIRYINPPGARGEPVTEPQLTWMRTRETLPEAGRHHEAGLAYLSDSTLIDHIMLPFGMRWQDADFLGVSLDHAMWFHRPARADDWLLFEQSVEATGAGRGLARGRIFTRDGALVATCMQEGLMRWVEGGG